METAGLGGEAGALAQAGNPGSGGSATCFEYAEPIRVGTVDNAALSEISGVAASRSQPGVLYVHNDSGDSARFLALAPSGETLGEYALSGATAIDWEDMAIGPGPGGSDFVFLGDIGDNAARTGGSTPRASVDVYRVSEPAVSWSSQSPSPEPIESFDRLTFTYPDGPHDAEVLMIDPEGPDIVIISKENDGNSAIFRAPSDAPAEGPVVLEKLGNVLLGTSETPGNTL